MKRKFDEESDERGKRQRAEAPRIIESVITPVMHFFRNLFFTPPRPAPRALLMPVAKLKPIITKDLLPVEENKRPWLLVDIWAMIFNYLPLVSFKNVASTSRYFNQLIHHETILSVFIRNLNIPATFLANSPKERIMRFLAECKFVLAEHPAEIIAAFGGVKRVAAMPILDIGERAGATDYIDFINPEELVGHEASRGVDCYKRPFIALCLKTSKIDGTPADLYPIAVLTLFKRYTDSPSWACGSGQYATLPYLTGRLNVQSYQYLTRLNNHQPCGKPNSNDGNDVVRVTLLGNSIIELTDQVEPTPITKPSSQGL